MSRSNPLHKSALSGRTGQILDIYDWGTPKGQEILRGRNASPKWMSLNSEDFRYVILVFLPELEYQGKVGVAHPQLFPLLHPRMDGNPPLFSPYPLHLLDLLTGKRRFAERVHDLS
jgi:hypothetical protein